MSKTKKISKAIMVRIALIIGIFLVILPYAYTILYSLPSTDDFWMAAGVDKSTLFHDAVTVANSFWMGWGGMWLYIFLEVFLNPLLLFGAGSPLLGVELLLFFLFFLAALWIVNRTFWKLVIKVEEKNWILGSYLLILVWFLNTEVWTEVFYWFVGSTYMWASAFVFLTIALELSYFKKPRISTAIVMTIIGMAACSFYTQAVFPGLTFLVLLLVEFGETGKISWRKCPIFVCFVLGALSSLAAPGNFVRKGEDIGLVKSLILALKDTLILCFDSLFDLLKNPLSIVMMAIFLVMGMFVLKERSRGYRYPAVPFAVTLFALYVAYFPFAFGYGGTSYAPNRMKFAFQLFAVLLFAMSFLYLGGWLRYEKNVVLERKHLVYGAVGILAFAYVCLIPTKYYEELPYAQTVAQTRWVKVANDEWRYLLYRIESSEEENVVLERSYINTPIIKQVGITYDKEYSVNRHIAEYYNKESVCVYWW